MKKETLFKKILAYALALALTVSGFMPVQAAAVQQADEAAETVLQEQPKMSSLSPSAEGLFTGISSYERYFRIEYSRDGFDGADLTVTWNGKTVYSSYNDGYVSGTRIYASQFWDGNRWGLQAGTYTFTLTPYVYNEDDDKISYPANAQSLTWTCVAPPKPVVQMKGITANGPEFSYGQIPEGASLNNEKSETADFKETTYESIPGKTYYFRAWFTVDGVQGPKSDPIAFVYPVADVTGIGTEVTDTSVTLTIYTSGGGQTGLEISRKSGKKYQKLTTISGNTYADLGLEKDTKYSYQVRAIYYDKKTNQTVYGDYSYVSVTTGKAAMNLKANPSGKTAAKLTWDKVAGVSGYDIYRYTVGFSGSKTIKAGENYNFSKYELVKSLGAKKKTYTDKKLTSGEEYEYLVKAFKMEKGKKLYITQGYANVVTEFNMSGSIRVEKEITSQDGSLKVTWKQIPQANGYLVEKYDEKTREWVTQENLANPAATTCTLPAAPVGKTIEYRIRAYKGNKYSQSETFTTGCGSIAAVANIRAQAVADGIQVSWDPVPGASYYRVYRTTNPEVSYNLDTKMYGYNVGGSISPMAFKAWNQEENGDNFITLGSSAVKMVRDYKTAETMEGLYPTDHPEYSEDDKTVSGTIAGTSVTDYVYSVHNFTGTGAEKKETVTEVGPREGVTYYYCVTAYAFVKNPDAEAPAWQKYIEMSSFGYNKAASVAYGTPVGTSSLSKVKAGKKSASLTFKKVDGAVGYAIYRSTKKKGAYMLVGATNKTSYKDSGLMSKKTYYYKVRAYKGSALGTDAFSAFSNVKSIKAK